MLQKAQAIDDSLSEVYASLALITYCYEWDLPAAEGYARRGIELNPLNIWAHGWYAEIAGTRGKLQEALEAAKKGVEIDPLSAMAHALLGIVIGVVERVEEGREYLRKTLAMEPDQPMFHLWLGMEFLMQPKVLEEAIEHLQRACQLGVSAAYGYLGMAYASAGRKEEALTCLRKLERIEQEPFIPFPFRLLLWLKPGLRQFRCFKKKYCPAYLKAFIYCGMNQPDEAFAHLEESGLARDYLLPVTLYMMHSYDFPGVADFVASPRFQALEAQIRK